MNATDRNHKPGPSFQIKPKRGIASHNSKKVKTPKRYADKQNIKRRENIRQTMPSNLPNIDTTDQQQQMQETGNVVIHSEGLHRCMLEPREVATNSKQYSFPRQVKSTSKKSTVSNLLELGFDTNQELVNIYEQHVGQQEEIVAKLSAHIDRLEEVHSSAVDEPELLQLRIQGAELRAALTDSQSAIHAERRLVAALHADNIKLQLELLQVSQRAVSLQIVSGVSDARVETLQGTELVRSKMPDKLKKLQQKLWSQADHETATGNISPETVLSLQQRVRSAEDSLAFCEKEWAEERACLVEERELREQEAQLDQVRVTAWVKKAQERMAECQRDGRATAAQCVQLSKELQLQQRQHRQERGALLRALAKLGGPERLKQELEALDVSSSCLQEVAGHASSSCQARELKLLTLQLQRELSESRQLLEESHTRTDVLQKEKCILRQAREDALTLIKKQRSSASEQRQVLEAQQERSHQRTKTEMQAAQAQLAQLHADLKKLVHMIYKLVMWQSDQCGSDNGPPSPPAWLDGPRAVTRVARQLQSAIEATRTRLAGVRNTMLRDVNNV
uniref:Coiled-coil domain-containing protein 150-like n=3 Tax=Hirondellea gigas TaxID=1518452 RepID=A0A6A7G360_9CRUS